MTEREFELSHKNEILIRKTQDSPCQKCSGKTGCATCLAFQNYAETLVKQNRKARW